MAKVKKECPECGGYGYWEEEYEEEGEVYSSEVDCEHCDGSGFIYVEVSEEENGSQSA